MIRKIIYIHEMFFRKHSDLGIDYFKEHDYEVELWSIYKIKYRDSGLQIPLDAREDVYYPDNIYSLFARLIREDARETLLFFTTAIYAAKIEDMIRIIWGWKGGGYCDLPYAIVPIGNVYTTVDEKKRQPVVNAATKKILQKIQAVKWMGCQFLLTHPCHLKYCFGVSTTFSHTQLNEWEQKRFIAIHTKDYDEYILGKREQKPITEEYLVFIDAGMTSAEDFCKNKKDQICIYPDAKIYYRNIQKLLDELEEHYKTKAVIAAHPKSEYEGDEFGVREIVYFRTTELIREAKLIITHASCAINQIIMYQKPFIFVYDSYIRKNVVWDIYFAPLLELLPIIPYNMDDNTGDIQQYINRYNDGFMPYYQTYIKENEDDGKLFYEIAEEYIKRI